jgi:AraC-like DNA-binding protein
MELPIDFSIRSAGTNDPETLRTYARWRLGFALRRFENKIRRVIVRLGDINGPKRGIDSHCSITLQLRDGGAPIDVKLRSASMGAIGLTYLDYGGAVRIEPVPLKDFFLVQVPLGGSARIRCGTDEIVSTPDLASVPHPDSSLWMEWGAGNPQIIFYAAREALELQLGRLLGRPGRHPLEFDLGMRMADPHVAAWWRSVELLREDIVAGSPLLDEPLAARQLEQMIMNRLLLSQPHTASALLRGGGDPAPQSHVVSRARTLMEDHCAEELTVADVAEAVGVSVRALQEGFRRDLSTSPTAYLRDLRMTRANAELRVADPSHTSVTEIAMRCGFVHLGRFSVEYRRRFGESPRHTLATS